MGDQAQNRSEKLDDVLPRAMQAHGINMWIMIDRENNEEPLHDEVEGAIPRRSRSVPGSVTKSSLPGFT